MVSNRQYEAAYKIIQELRILPLQENLDLDTFNSDNYLKFWDDYIKENLSDILLATMTCIYRIYKQNKTSVGSPKTQSSLVKAARALVTFSGTLLDYRLPSNVYGDLVQMQAEIS